MTTFSNNFKRDEIRIQKIREMESLAPLCFCDNCGRETKCKPYSLNEGNAILCSRCWSIEMRFQTSDERGYTICDGSKDSYKRNFQSWHMTQWYGLDEIKERGEFTIVFPA